MSSILLQRFDLMPAFKLSLCFVSLTCFVDESLSKLRVGAQSPEGLEKNDTTGGGRAGRPSLQSILMDKQTRWE